MNIRENLDKFFDKYGFEIWGLLGAGVCIIVPLLSTIGYIGNDGESFSMFEHFVSDLGDLVESENAWLFNLGLIIGGFLLIPFIIGFALYIDNSYAELAMVIGVYAAFSTSFVGFFPMNYILLHIIAAGGAFLGAAITIFFFFIASVFQKKDKRLIIYFFAGIIGAVILVSIIIFADKPEFMTIYFFEWFAFLYGMTWIAVGCTYWLIFERNKALKNH